MRFIRAFVRATDWVMDKKPSPASPVSSPTPDSP